MLQVSFWICSDPDQVEISLLIGLSVLYFVLRTKSKFGGFMSSSLVTRPGSPAFATSHATRDKSGRGFTNQLMNGIMTPPTNGGADQETFASVESRGCVWGTEAREYRYALARYLRLISGPVSTMESSSLYFLVR